MALGKCKECGKQVSTNAFKCPHCGARNPTATMKEMILGFLVLVVVGLMVAQCTGSDNTEQNVSVEKVAEIPSEAKKTTLSISYSQFKDRYNNAFVVPNSGKNPAAIRSEKKQEGGKPNHESIQIETTSDFVGLIIDTLPDEQVVSLVLIGAGNGEIESGGHIMLGVTAVVHAVDSTLSIDERNDLVSQLFKDLKNNNVIRRNGIKYDISMNEYTGLMFIVSPEK